MPAVRLEIRVEGIVRSVGFRPFVYALAGRLGLGLYEPADKLAGVAPTSPPVIPGAIVKPRRRIGCEPVVTCITSARPTTARLPRERGGHQSVDGSRDKATASLRRFGEHVAPAFRD